eukprot:7534942-Alexandrium_andersonii.AAC.1
MSASLVGSEMCIRDSSTFDLLVVYPPPPANFSTCQPPTSQTSFRPSPVSYTHLTLPTICSV